MLPLFILNPIAAALSLTTLLGVVVHDTHFDKLTVQLTAPVVVTAVGVASVAPPQPNDMHTHVERVSLSNVTRMLQAGSPRIQPRNSSEKKHMLQKNVARGQHPFDNYNLPILD